jgi:hypothetical protein
MTLFLDPPRTRHYLTYYLSMSYGKASGSSSTAPGRSRLVPAWKIQSARAVVTFFIVLNCAELAGFSGCSENSKKNGPVASGLWLVA